MNTVLNLRSIEEILKYTKKIDHLIFSSCGHTTDFIVVNAIKDNLYNSIQIEKTYIYQEHHLYHASSSFYNSGFTSALSIVLDGGGFHKSFEDELNFHELESVYLSNYNKIVEMYKHYSDYVYYTNPRNNNDFFYEKQGNFFSNTLSCGGLFNLISSVVGFDGVSAGKTMGLAAYGKSENVAESWFDEDTETGCWKTNTSNITESLNQRFTLSESLSVLAATPDLVSKVSESVGADLAKKTQVETRDHTIRLIEKYTKLTGEKNVVLSGGYFLNCSNKYEYIKRFPNLRFFVDPIALDGGTAIRAAKYIWHKLTGDTTVRRLETLYLG